MTPQSATAAVSRPMATEPQPDLREPVPDQGSSPAPERLDLRRILVNGTVSLAALVAAGTLGLLYDAMRDDIDTLGSDIGELEDKIDELDNRMDERFAEQDDKIERLDDKIDAMDDKIDNRIDEVVVLLASLIARLEESGTISSSDAATAPFGQGGITAGITDRASD